MIWIGKRYLQFIKVKRSLGHLEYPAQVKPLMEKLEISLTLELMRRVDEIVELLSFGSREEFLMAAVRRLVDHYLIISESIARTS